MRGLAAILVFGLMLFPTVAASTPVFVFSPDKVRYEVWGGFNEDAVGNSSYVDVGLIGGGGYARLWINDTSGSWGLSKISRGLMPHYWGLRYGLLDDEFEVKRNMPTWDLILDIDLKLVNYTAYDPGNSSTNVAIVLFFDGYKEDYQVKCYQTELQFFSYYKDNVYANRVSYFEWRGDGVAQFKLADNLKPGEYKHYSIRLNDYIQQMMDYYKLDHVKLKHVEIFTEAYKGYCEFEVYQAKIYVDHNLASPHMIKPLTAILIGIGFCAIALLIFIRR
ncbi:MAG: hypothetical protein WHS82_00790 [Candidatus Methanosuratincola sp.]